MLHSVTGGGVDEASSAGDTTFHQLSTGMPGLRHAQLELRFEASQAGTRMRIGAQDPPWKVVRAFPQPTGGSLVHLHNVSGGILAGDQLSLSIEVGAGAIAQVTTTGATRLYRHRDGSADSQQQISISVAEGAVLEYLPDALIPFGGSRHKQSTVVKLADQASFFWWEVLAPGRQAMGEQFGFERLQIETEVRSARRPLALENYVLQPKLRPLESIARLGAYTHTTTFYAFQVGRSTGDFRQLESTLAEVARESCRPGVSIWGASALASDGIIVRGLSTTAREIPATLARFWTTARQFLTGEAAVPPRKLK